MANSEQRILNHLAQLENDARNNVLMNSTIKGTVQKILESVDNKDVSLKVKKIWIDDKNDNNNIALQQEIRNKGQIWGSNLRAQLELVDKETGKVVDEVSSIKIANIPKLTPRNTYLIGGNEYQFMKQSRLRPGVYTKEQTNGDIVSFFNVDKTIDFDRGFNNNFKLNFNPESKVFTMNYGTKTVPLINAMAALDVPKDKIIESWGKDVYEENERKYGKHENINTNKLYLAIFGKIPPKDMPVDTIKQEIKNRLFATELDPETTKVTLGKAYNEVNSDSLLAASRKAIALNRGDDEPDDRESLIFKSFFDAEDHIRERLIKNLDKIKWNVGMKLSKTKSINKSLSSQTFDPFISGTITTSQLSNPPNQTNVISIIGDSSKTTVMGEGGIGSQNAITSDTRDISNSEAGFIDPLHTPEGGSIGITVHTSMGAMKIGDKLYNKFLDTKGNPEIKSPDELFDKYVAFPDEYDITGKKPVPKTKHIRAIFRNKMVNVLPDKIDYIISSPTNMFDTSVNMIPFLDSIQGNRGLTASKMQEQAVSLVHREKPLFQIVDQQNRNMGEMIGSAIGIPKAPEDGTVTRITDKSIFVKDKKGVEHEVQMYRNFSLNSESYLDNEPLVKEGDKVKKDQSLADNNFTKDGTVALGTNLKVAYLPYKGYNYEDSAVISESGAKKLTSTHMYDLKARRSDKGVFSTNKFRAYYPEEINAQNAKKLDKDGVIKVGEQIERDDVVIAHMERKIPTADDIALGRFDKQLRRDMANNAVTWDNDHIGTVTAVQKHGNSVVVNVKTEEPLKVADKISGLHGNKHILAAILPDDKMPIIKETGERIDLTMSPIGVSNRINTSQLLENAAGKIAAKTGKPYIINNFRDVDNTEQILKDLKEAGISDKDILIDPETGKEMKNPVATGISHILKLEHKVDHKLSSRYRDGYDSNEQAASGGHTGGKNLGRMEMAALLARGATENLKEMFQIKGQRNDEYWQAMETGQSLPVPKKAFVWDKMLAAMAGAGINVEQKGKVFTMKPMTDDDILEMSKGELKNPTETYRKKDLAPIREGLFDPVKAGGMQGEFYSHFKLPEKILNPITANAAANIVGLPQIDLERVIAGKKFVDKKTGEVVTPGTPGSISGGPAVERLLKNVDIDADLKAAEERIKTVTNSTEINKLNKKIKTLRSLKKNGMKPTDYMIENVLVTPSKFRPMFSMGTEGTVILSDVNDLYQQTAKTADTFKEYRDELKKVVDSDDVTNLQLAEARNALYQDVKAITGLGDPTAYLLRQKNKKGFITLIDGGKEHQTKQGLFQSKVMQRRQDLVGRSTIILNPSLGGDELGIPKLMANDIFRPFIMQKLVSWGYKPLDAQKQIEEDTEIFQRARQVVADERLVIANRAPTVHRWNMTAFKPKLTDGKSIEVPGIVVSKNFGGDFDGDSCIGIGVFAINKAKFLKKFGIDFMKETYYINGIDWINKRKVSMPSIAKLVIEKGEELIHIDLSDFPKIESSKRVKENGNESYDVPSGLYAITCDNETGKVIKVPITEYSIHRNLENCIINLSSRDQLLVSSDESLIGIDTSTWNLSRYTPDTIIGKAIPRIARIEHNCSISSILITNFLTNTKSNIALTKELGHLIGIMVGDGWISPMRPDQACFANVDPVLSMQFKKEFDECFNTISTMNSRESLHEFDGKKCFSIKHTLTSGAWVNNFSEWIGKGAINKHIPAFSYSAPLEFKLGLLAGLIDTDGSVCFSNSGERKTPQCLFSYNTISSELAMQVVTMCRTMGIHANISEYHKSSGDKKLAYVVTMSSRHMHDISLELFCQDKAVNLLKFQSTPMVASSVSARMDLVPVSQDLFDLCRKNGMNSLKNRDEYGSMKTALKTGAMPRVTAKKIIAIVGDKNLPEKWISIVNNADVTWVYAKEVIRNKNRITMYDITAPGPYTFMLLNGIIVQDTFQLHVPIGPKAMKEAELMKPSAGMLKAGYDTVLNTPAMDMIVGTYLLSKGMGGEIRKEKFDTIEEARKLLKSGKLSYADTVSIDGIKAPFGMHEINSVVPEDMRDYKKVLNSKNAEQWIKDVVIKHNGKMGMDLANKMKDIGNVYTTEFGFTMGVSDTVAAKDIRERVVKEAVKNTDWKSPESIVTNFQNATRKGIAELKQQHGDKTMLGIGIESGGSKGIGNTAAITLMPGILSDAEDRPMPVPIIKSYSEGLGTAAYWAAAHGARGGNIKKSTSAFRPGWLTKDLVNSVYETRIASEEPVDTEGIEYGVDDKKGIVNRYLARDVKDKGGNIVGKRNDPVDDNFINKITKAKIKSIFVQSPLTDPTPGDGFSSWSYGSDYEGKRQKFGDYIGIQSAHTITEPSLNLAMKAFHTGGSSLGKSSGSVFDALDRVLKFAKKIPDKAVVSSMDGIIKKISKSSIGGYDVTVSNGDSDEIRYVDTGRELKVKVGDTVKQGDLLSDGTVSPHDILKYQGMRATQKHLVGEIEKIMPDLNKRDIETVVRGISNTTRIMDSGSSTWVKGDVAPLTTVDYYNNNNLKEEDVEDTVGDHFAEDVDKFKKHKKIEKEDVEYLYNKGVKRINVFKDRIKHEDFLTPNGIGEKAAVSDDWIARLAHSRLRKVFEEGTTQSWKSDVGKELAHPVSYLVTLGSTDKK